MNMYIKFTVTFILFSFFNIKFCFAVYRQYIDHYNSFV